MILIQRQDRDDAFITPEIITTTAVAPKTAFVVEVRAWAVSELWNWEFDDEFCIQAPELK